jgi:hypothetical protein
MNSRQERGGAVSNVPISHEGKKRGTLVTIPPLTRISIPRSAHPRCSSDRASSRISADQCRSDTLPGSYNRRRINKGHILKIVLTTSSRWSGSVFISFIQRKGKRAFPFLHYGVIQNPCQNPQIFYKMLSAARFRGLNLHISYQKFMRRQIGKIHGHNSRLFRLSSFHKSWMSRIFYFPI